MFTKIISIPLRHTNLVDRTITDVSDWVEKGRARRGEITVGDTEENREP